MKKYQYSHSGNVWSELVVKDERVSQNKKNSVKVRRSQNSQGIWITVAGKTYVFRESAGRKLLSQEENHLFSPMPAKVIEILVSQGDKVDKNQSLIRLEAMKMEYVIKAPEKGIVKSIAVAEGEQVGAHLPLLDIE